MAYWLYCLTCKQWSKSDTPLSDDKICTYCNNFFVKAKQVSSLNSDIDKITVEKLKNEPTSTAPQTHDLNNAESSKADTTEVTTDQETPTNTDLPSKDDSHVTAESVDSNKEGQESIKVNESRETSELPQEDKIEVMDKDEVSKETKQEITSTQEPQELDVTKATNEINEVTEEFDSDERDDEGEDLDSSASDNDEGNDDLESTSELDEGNDDLDSSTSQADDDLEPSSPESDEDQDLDSNSDTPEETESLATNESNDNVDSSEKPEEQELQKFENIPAHRLYIENRRRRKKHN